MLSLHDPERAAEAIVHHAGKVPLDAVVAADQGGAHVAALASARLGLRASSPQAVACAHDKALMRRALAEAGVSQPAHRLAGAGDDVIALAREVGLPCVLKPLALSGSRGVIRADSDAGVAAAAARVRAIVGDVEAPVLIETYVPGAEVALEGLMRAGTLEPLAIFDKPDPLTGPYFAETLYITPSRHPRAILDEVERTAAAAAAALGLNEGPIHAELRIGTDVVLLELAARSIGGLCSRTLRFGLGLSLEEVILRHALELPLDHLRRMPGASGVMMLPTERAGTLLRVDGEARARATAGIQGLEITIAPGRELVPLPEGSRYLGFLFARADVPAAVEASLRSAFAELDVVVAADDRLAVAR
ncbi:MAG: ATP-grasp domain-containing protein [Thermoleophilaceae bacterium]